MGKIRALYLLICINNDLVGYAKDADTSYLAGEILHQPDLAWSLERISEQGANAFYSGDIAEKIIDFMERSGGYISSQDLQRRTSKPLQSLRSRSSNG